MRAVLASRTADDIPFAEQVLAFGCAERRFAAEHDHPLLVQVMRVIRPEPVATRCLGHGCADQLAADALPADRGADAPAVAIPRPIPLVTVEVEGLHAATY